jgi:ATP-dependent Clp protease ATP-binding subunit ClpA
MFDFDRYDRKTRDTLRFAHITAAEAKADCVSSEHLLSGLIRAAPGALERFLGSTAAVEAIAVQLSLVLPRLGGTEAGQDEIAVSPEVVSILQRAAHEASGADVHPEHILFAIMKVEKSPAAELLRSAGLDVAQLQRFVHSKG